MKRLVSWKTFAVATLAAVIFGAGALVGAVSQPKSVIHVVTVKWNDGASREQIDAALKGVVDLADGYDGITRVWTRSVKAQGPESGVTAAFVMEFKDEQALEDYSGSDAQKEWYKVYLPVRELSRTFDITN